MNIHISKTLILSLIAVVLVLIQTSESTILIEAALIFITLALAKINKNDGRKFDFYAWSVMFGVFVIQFILKAFIVV